MGKEREKGKLLHPNVYQCIIHNFQKDADVKQGVTHDSANEKEKERLVVEDATVLYKLYKHN